MLLHESSDPQAPRTVNPREPAPPEERYLTRGEAAQYLGLPVSTIYQWARTGRLPCFVTLGGHLRFSKAALDRAATPRPRAARRRHPIPSPIVGSPVPEPGA